MTQPIDFKNLPPSFGKPTDCITGRLIQRRLSRPLTLLFLRTQLTPDAISFLSFVFSLLSVWFVSRGDYLNGVIGGLLFELATVIDNCDGEVARLKKIFTSYGEKLDVILDHVALLLFFIGVFWGVKREGGLPHIQFMGIEGAIVLFFLLAIGHVITFVYKRHAPPEITRLYKGYKAYLKARGSGFLQKAFVVIYHLLQRGFYGILFLLLALLGKLHWLLLLFVFGIHAALLATLLLVPYLLLWQIPRKAW